MATTQYKDNAGNIHEFQQESGDAGGAEKRPITGLPAAVRTQLANMTSALLALAGTVLDGVLKVSLQAGSAVIGKLAPNAGVNIGTVDVASGTFAMGGPIPAGSAHIGSVAVDAALPAGANTIGKVDVNVLPASGQLPGNLGAKTSAASLSVVHSTDHPPQVVNLSGAVPAGTNNIGDVDVATLPALPQLPASLGQKAKTASLSTVLASDQGPVLVSDGGAPLMVIGAGGNPLPVSGTVTVGNSLVVHLGTSLPAGNSNIGNVDVASLPPLPAGTNNIGDVDVLTLPALPAGSNNIGDVDVLTLPALSQLPATLGQKSMAASTSFTIASDQTAVATKTEVAADYDSGAGIQNVSMRGIALPAAGGAVAGGTATAPLRVDPTGTTVQPISDGNGSITVDGAVTVTAGTVSLSAALPAGTNNIGDVDVLTLPPLPAGANAIGKLAANVGVNIGTVGLAAGTTNIGDVDVLTLPALPQLPAALGPKTRQESLSVVISTDDGNGGQPVPVTEVRSAPSAVTVATIPASTTAVTLQGANSARRGLLIVNNKTSTSTLSVRFGSGAAPTNWSLQIEPGGTYEMPEYYYGGIVTGIWSNTIGDAHVTETSG